jgi:hypothetical protein
MLDPSRWKERLPFGGYGADDDDAGDDGAHGHVFSALHWLTAGVFLAAGIEAAVGRRRGNAPDDVRWGPLVVAPLAGAAHAIRALVPGPASRAAAQVFDGVAVGVGAVGLASSTWAVLDDDTPDLQHFGPRRRPLSKRIPSLAPLAFGAAGLLGMLLYREERAMDDEHDALERRARVVERLVPRRRARIERIVVHV